MVTLIVPETRALVSLIIPLAKRTKGAVVAAEISSASVVSEVKGGEWGWGGGGGDMRSEGWGWGGVNNEGGGGVGRGEWRQKVFCLRVI